LYIIKSLEVEAAGASPSEHPAYMAPALCMFGLLSVVFFLYLPSASVRFLGQVHGDKYMRQNTLVIVELGERKREW
jgi:hypothetical protein